MQDNEIKIPPVTPIRRFLCKLPILRSGVTLGERVRRHSISSLRNHNPHSHPTTIENSLPTPSSIPSSDDIFFEGSFSPATGSTTRQLLENDLPQGSRLAIQQHDTFHDAIVITTLPTIPFCCHEDLVTMPRVRLLDVANMFNSRLPVTSRIPALDTASDAQIRQCVEALVGIIPAVPGAPKSVRLRDGTEADINVEGEAYEGPSPPSSPLAMRVYRRRTLHAVSSPPLSLESLIEEDEDHDSMNPRTTKRRRISSTQATLARIHFGRRNSEVEISSNVALRYGTFDGPLSIDSVIEATLSEPSTSRGPKRPRLLESPGQSASYSTSERMVNPSVDKITEAKFEKLGISCSIS